MTTENSLYAKFANSRRKLQNPYAHAEEIEKRRGVAFVFDSVMRAEHAASREVADRPKLLKARGNPYAFAVEDLSEASSCENSALSGGANDEPARRHPNFKTSAPGKGNWNQRLAAIENAAHGLQKRLWRARKSLNIADGDADPTNLLEPAIALNILGYSYIEATDLGNFNQGGRTIQVAGYIDSRTKEVRIGAHVTPHQRRFTAAHELGHAVLHRFDGVAHRDRPLDGASFSRSPEEREADAFAVAFLMPKNLVISRFLQCFGQQHFEADEANMFRLGVSTFRSREQLSDMELAKMLASCSRFDGRQFNPIHQQFGVSVVAMAIRLKELRIIGNDTKLI